MSAEQDKIRDLLRQEPVDVLRRIAEQDRIRSIPLSNIEAWCEVQYNLSRCMEATGMSRSDAAAKSNSIVAELARERLAEVAA